MDCRFQSINSSSVLPKGVTDINHWKQNLVDTMAELLFGKVTLHTFGSLRSSGEKHSCNLMTVNSEKGEAPVRIPWRTLTLPELSSKVHLKLGLAGMLMKVCRMPLCVPVLPTESCMDSPRDLLMDNVSQKRRQLRGCSSQVFTPNVLLAQHALHSLTSLSTSPWEMYTCWYSFK